MSCFEQSVFKKNHAVLDIELLAQACENMGWQYIQKGNSFVVTSVPHGPNTSGEAVLTVTGNQVKWNNYYRRDGQELSSTLQQSYQNSYNAMQVQYALDAINKAFTSRGFTLLQDRNFAPGSEVKHRFWMKSRSKEASEKGVITKILFEVLNDGSVRTDSDYIPRDVHEWADAAMDELSRFLGVERKISPKDIPAKYRHKAFCHPKNKIQQKSK